MLPANSNPPRPGRVEIHYNGTGFFREACDTEEAVLDTIKKYMKDMPAYHPDFFRVADPVEPKFPAEDIYSLVPFKSKERLSAKRNTGAVCLITVNIWNTNLIMARKSTADWPRLTAISCGFSRQ